MSNQWKFAVALSVLAAGIAGVSVRAENDAGTGKDEQKITLDQAPAAVKATIQRESENGTVTEVEKEVKKGKAVYEADVTINGKPYELKVAEDGTLLKKKVDDDKDDKDDAK